MAAIPAAASDGAKEAQEIRALRSEVLKGLFAAEGRSAAVAGAYKNLFTYVGLARLKKLADDEDKSIALQAAWELHRKPVKRSPPMRYRTAWGFDKKRIEEFLGFVAKRLTTEPPEWWGATLMAGDVFPNQHHAFIDIEGGLPTAPKVQVDKDEVTITLGNQLLRLPKMVYGGESAFADIGPPAVVLVGAKQSFVARPTFRGYPFNVVGVDSKTGGKLWLALVWAARRGFSSGPARVNPVEIRRQGDTVIVYGCDSHGMYAEGFDAKTGKCQFRFCTCYWFNFSEAWGLK
jgi:hypothetical protein